MTLILELPSNKEAALKAKAQAEGVSAEQYVQRMLDRELDQQASAPADADDRPIWEVIVDQMKDVPPEDFAALPNDGASQVDHYIYGLPKRD
ncbi:MAG: hypothetical protein JOY85_10530 [Acidobacteriaceae bacterium]|nr:hypothetical protein [Acidobacteriaceae bacterium]